MKTQKFIQIVRWMTLSTILGIFSLTVSAGMIQDENRSPITGGVDDGIKEANEQMELEQWMTNSDHWIVKTSTNMMEAIAMEDWMTETPFMVGPATFENTIEMEPWMTDRYAFQTEEERELDQLESWMVSKEQFEIHEQSNLNAIEDWMVDEAFWKI